MSVHFPKFDGCLDCGLHLTQDLVTLASTPHDPQHIGGAIADRVGEFLFCPLAIPLVFARAISIDNLEGHSPQILTGPSLPLPAAVYQLLALALRLPLDGLIHNS